MGGLFVCAEGEGLHVGEEDCVFGRVGGVDGAGKREEEEEGEGGYDVGGGGEVHGFCFVGDRIETYARMLACFAVLDAA